MSPRMKNSLICSRPSPFESITLRKPTSLQFRTQSSALTSAMALPMMPVARFGSSTWSLVNVASAGAVKYSRKMKSSDHATDCRAARTDGVVK